MAAHETDGLKYSERGRLTCNVELGGGDFVLHFALVKAFVFTADVCYAQFPLLAVLDTEVLRIIDINRLQHGRRLAN